MRPMFLNSTALRRTTQIELRDGRLPLREFEPGSWAWQWTQHGDRWDVSRVVTTVIYGAPAGGSMLAVT